MEDIIENYYHIQGLDESVLCLNPLIKEEGLEFIKFSFLEFQNKFHKYFLSEFDELSESTTSVSFNDKEIYSGVSMTFESIIHHSSLICSFELEGSGYLILLKDIIVINSDINEIEEVEIESEIDEDDYFDYEKYLTPKIKSLINKLRIFKKGHLKLISCFTIYRSNEFIRLTESYNIPVSYDFKNYRYRIDLEDLDFISSHIQKELSIPPLLELAFDSFNESYNIDHLKLKYVTLIIALESIFNRSGQDPIQHIISRHVSLLLSSTREEFETISKNVKELYNIRSIIVHGKTEGGELKKIEKLQPYLDRLEDVVRDVLKKLIWMYDFEEKQPTKDSLFSYLNAKGFEG